VAELPRGTVTTLFTDIEGSTRLLQKLGTDAYREQLELHRHLLRAAVASHGGREMGAEGDSLHVAFARASDAVIAAAEAQRALRDASWPYGEPIRVRIGIHTGEPDAADNYVGLSIHNAARVMAAAHGGQTLVSETTAALVGAELQSDLHDLGEHRLKDLSEPQRLFQLGPGDFPPLKTLYRAHLPIPATPFLGRERELGELSELLLGDDVRLLTLTGPGGTGKTRLAVQLAANLSGEFASGVFWIPLATLVDPELVLPSIARTLRVQDDLADFVGDKRLLLLLDNFEHITVAAVGLAQLLAECPNLKLLITSRAPLHVSGEQEYRVEPLPDSDAEALFVKRARAVKPNFEHDGAVGPICRRLDGLPLAIELAAARVKVIPPEAMLARLDQRLPLLTGGPRDAPERQRTLRATIEWSYDMLDEAEGRLFARLAIFAGGCTHDAAEQVCEADLDTLQALVEKNLIRQTDTVFGARFWMLQTIGEFAGEQLSKVKGDAERTAESHADHYIALAELAEPELMKPDQAAWLDRLEVEQDNFRGALRFLLECGERERALVLATSLARFWRTRGHLAEATRWFESTLDAEVEVDPLVLGRALSEAGTTADLQGDYVRAGVLLDRASAIFTEIDDIGRLAWTLNNRGIVAANRQELEKARELHERSLALAREVEDSWLIASASINLGNIAFFEEDYDRAAELEEDGLRMCLALGDRHRAALACLNLGWVHLRAGATEQAKAYLLDSLTAFGELHEKRRLPDVLEGLAGAAALEHQYERTARLFAAAYAMRDELDSPVSEHEATLYETYFVSVRDAIGTEGFNRAWREGQAMAVEQAIEYARVPNGR
jgi:predicted ATPase/class 3 adenylate cyclase